MSDPNKSKPPRRLGPWPHGFTTATCPACEGTGHDRVKVLAYITSRNPYAHEDLSVKCDRCDGRGRVIVGARVAS